MHLTDLRWYYAFIFSFTVSRGWSSLLDFITVDEAQILSDELVNTVIGNYFQNDRCLVFVSDFKDPVMPVNGISNLSYVLISSEDVCGDPALVDKLVFAIDWCCYGYIIKATNPSCVLQAWGKAQFSHDVPTLQRVTPKIFTVISDKNLSRMPLEIMDELLSLPESELSSNIVVASLYSDMSDWPVSLYTNNFYERVDSQDRESKIFLDRWSRQKGFELGTDLYSDKIINMRGKVLKTAAVDILPYVRLDFVGEEPEMIKLFCKFHNCTPIVLSDDYFWGDIFDNGTGNGILGLVYDGRADLGIGGVYMWASFFRHVEFSHSYLQSGATLLVPKPEILGGWLIPFLPFSAEMWIAYFLSVGGTGISMYLITKATIKYTRFSGAVKKRGMFLAPMDSVFRSLGLSVLQQPSTPLIPHTPIRHLFTSFEIFYLVLCTVYAAELASYLTAPQYSKPIDTLQDLARSGLIWIAEHAGWVYSLLDVDSSTIKTVVNNFRVFSWEKIDELAATGKYGLIMERLAGGHFINRSYLNNEVVITQSHIMAQQLYDSHVITLMRKASPYFHHFNKLIGKLLNNGLILYWEAAGSRMYLSSRMQTALEAARKLNVEDVVKPLALSNCLGMFLLFLGGILIATLVFIWEILVAKNSSNEVN